MTADVYRMVNECDSCVNHRISLKRNASRLKLLLATAPWESVTIDVLRLIQATKREVIVTY